MGRPPACNPCCNPVRQGYCTHRKIEPVTPEVEWSRSISTTTGSNTANVYGSAVDDAGNLYVGGTYGGDTSGTIQKWSPAGVLLWKVNLPVAVRCVTTDGTFVWAGGFYPPLAFPRPDETLYKLNCSNGVEVWRSGWGTTGNLDINDITHDGDGQVYLAHQHVDGALDTEDAGCGYVSLVDEDGDTITRFGGNDGRAECLALDDDGNLFVGSTLWKADLTACEEFGCHPEGNVAKYNASHELVWLTLRNLASRQGANLSFPLLAEFYVSAIDVHDGFLFIGYTGEVGEAEEFEGSCTLEKWNATDSTFVWGIPTGASVPDVAADDDFVYAVSGHKLLKISEDGYDGGLGLEWCNENWRDRGGPGEAEAPYWTVSLFAGDEYLPDPFVYVGGQAADCTIEDEGECTIDECECSYEEQCDCLPPDGAWEGVGPFGGIYSRHCPCEEIPCSIPDTFYGSGCFEGIEVNYTWYYAAEVWTAIFEIPCDGAANPFVVTLTAVEASDVECTGWEVSYHITHNASDGSGCDSLVTGTASVPECWCSEESPYDHPWFTWQADGLDFGADCVCCDGTGGGGNVPPGVEVACCENELPLTLTAEISNITNCSTIGGLATLTWNAGTSKWEGSIAQCDNTFNISFYCSGSDASGFRMDLDAGGDSPGECGLYTAVTPSGTPSCDPLIVEFRFFPGYNFCPCCQGGPVGSQGFKIIVTE